MLMVLQHGIKIYHWYWILPDMSHWCVYQHSQRH